MTPVSIAMESLITDAYKVYEIGVAELSELLQRVIVSAGCFAHMRKYFIEALTAMGLSNLFYKVCTCQAGIFPETLNATAKNMDINLSQKGRAAIRIAYLVELLLRMDEDFAVSDRATLEDRRRRISAPLVDELYNSIKKLVDSMDGIEIIEDSNGNMTLKGEDRLPLAKALGYAINNWKSLTAFLTNGDIELTNNLCELMLRDVVRIRGASLHFFSIDGFRAYTDLMTIVKTCIMNAINPYYFVQWALDNAKLRLEEYRLKGNMEETTAQICYMPSPRYEEKDGKKIKISMYDKEFSCPFDKISWTGIDPWTYKRLMAREMSRLKNPPASEG